jgi:hypothetical protein
MGRLIDAMATVTKVAVMANGAILGSGRRVAGCPVSSPGPMPSLLWKQFYCSRTGEDLMQSLLREE